MVRRSPYLHPACLTCALRATGPHLLGAVSHSYEDENAYFRNYFGCIRAMDAQVGRLRAELESLGVANDTLIFFASDNVSLCGGKSALAPQVSLLAAVG